MNAMETREAASEVAVGPSQTEASTPRSSSGEGSQSSDIPIQDLNVGYGPDSDSQASTNQQAAQAAGEEDSNDGCSQAPVTPQRAQEINPGTPFTPLANLKMLIAAASSALDREREAAALEESNQSAASDVGSMCEVGSEGDDAGGRKMKSLSVLCKKFLSIAEEEIGMGHDFSLETMAKSLGTNRRRIYDIINVLEALEMIVKQSKNWYTWLGRSSLLPTLAKLRAMALDDPEFGLLFDKDECDKENQPLDSSSSSTKAGPSGVKLVQQLEVRGGAKLGVAKGEGEEVIVATEQDVGRGGRWDKSLGVLCQKFVMLFLIAPNQEVTLECAGSVLMPEGSEDPANPFAPLQPTHSKTKVRRLYDIANVLSTLGLIKKRTFMAPNHRKMPGYAWCGPSMSEIEAIPVYRKSGYSMGALYSRKKGTSLTRKPSFTSRPFLHQYEVRETHRPAPTTPVKTHSCGFRRNLSFGTTTTTTTKPPSCVLARPLCPKQLDYFHEVQEFEAEMQKHSHRYPHVASVFHEFIQKYQSTLEHASTGRAILPKPLSATRSSPTALLASNDLTNRVLTLPSSGSTLAPSSEVPICITVTQSSPVGAMNISVSSQNGNMASVVPTPSALISNGSSSQPKPYRKILPATMPALLNRACEIMNRKASSLLPPSSTYDQSSSVATCKPPNTVGTFPTESSPTGVQPMLCQSLKSPAIASEPSSSVVSTILDITCSTSTQPTSIDGPPKQMETSSITPLTTPEFSQTTNSCPSDGSEGVSNASASKYPPVAATPPSMSSGPPPLLQLLPQNVATTNDAIPPNQPTLTYTSAKPNGSGGVAVSPTGKPAPNMPTTRPAQMLGSTNCFSGVQTVNGGTSQELCTSSDRKYATEEKDKTGNTMANGVSLAAPVVSLACSQQVHKLANSTQLTTHGTLRSSDKEIYNRSFLNVENFLRPLSKARKSETLPGQDVPQKDGIPPPPLQSYQTDTQAPSRPSHNQQSPQGLPNMGIFVNQKPIPTTFEGNGTKSPQLNGNGVFSPTQRFDPNTFLAHPSQMFSSAFYPNVMSPGTSYPLAPNLSPFSSFRSGQHRIQVGHQQASSTVHSSVNDETSPPKRLRLEENP